MKLIIEYKRFLAYSEKINKGFFTTFSEGVNIIYGKNTSGKSTLLQAIHYTFGINDEQHKLEEILNEKTFKVLGIRVKDKTNSICDLVLLSCCIISPVGSQSHSYLRSNRYALTSKNTWVHYSTTCPSPISHPPHTQQFGMTVRSLQKLKFLWHVL